MATQWLSLNLVLNILFYSWLQFESEYGTERVNHNAIEREGGEKEVGRGKNEIHFIGFPDAEHTTQQNRANRELR